MFKNKFFGFAIIAAILLTVVMVVAQIPTAKSDLKDVPVAIVNNDQGKVGKQITNQITSSNSKKAVFDWHVVKSTSKMKKDMSQQHYYAAIVIPKNFSDNISSLIIPSVSHTASINLYINQAKNATLSSSIKPILTSLITKIGQSIATQMISNLGKANISISAATAEKMEHPIQIKTTTLHSTSGLLSANSIFFQPIWLASLVVSLMLFYAARSIQTKSWQHHVSTKLSHTIASAVMAILIGSLSTINAIWILGYHAHSILPLMPFLCITSFAFIMLFSGVLTWVGFPGVILFALLLFFSAPLMAMAPQMIPSFYQHWIMPWLPMRFLYEGTKSMLYYGSSYWNSSTKSLVVIMLVGFILFYAESFLPKHIKSSK
ncbi:ABC transporter permease [Paucilactobacillus suebicus]|uniref:ABC-2 type transporter transmembrane domain-containing protein n=1 Tax=Paucilactobacillus suebicus DSM 5007 = KCTC 3549 TaxID=1423807 RepID=A0A0R1VYT9_9LACO|nr:ABC transporter permease [Paucilactobacillus suebicus]KRM10573.1 hypothetical protein FD16_GL001175 [Paucilactobacillus suebicus DSM 5007 = KCTC 3549]